LHQKLIDFISLMISLAIVRSAASYFPFSWAHLLGAKASLFPNMLTYAVAAYMIFKVIQRGLTGGFSWMRASKK
jgi:hypothetical protein